jgi:hypothetical protein
MPTFERAQRVKNGMERGTGARYRIWFDSKHTCFRVLPYSEYRDGLLYLPEGQ